MENARKLASLANQTVSSSQSRRLVIVVLFFKFGKVLQCDSWKGDSWGKQWVLAWQKWGPEFTDPNYHFGKGSKADQNHHWYFGCDRDPSAIKHRHGYHSGLGIIRSLLKVLAYRGRTFAAFA